MAIMKTLVLVAMFGFAANAAHAGTPVKCFARNAKGQKFAAVSVFPGLARANALQLCRQSSVSRCVPAGCNY